MQHIMKRINTINNKHKKGAGLESSPPWTFVSALKYKTSQRCVFSLDFNVEVKVRNIFAISALVQR